MKLLCVVNRFLQKCLSEGLSGVTLTFCVQWDEASYELTQNEYDCAIVLGELVEDDVMPILFWSVASQMRLLNVPVVFVGLGRESSSVLAQYYSSMKKISYPSSAAEFFLSLQSVEPELFGALNAGSNIGAVSSVSSSRLASSDVGKRVVRESSSSGVDQRRGSLSRSSSEGGRSSARRKLEGFAEVSSAPLGLKPPSVSATRSAVPSETQSKAPFHPPVKKEEVTSSDLQYIISDISSISGLSPISSTEVSAIDKALRSSEEQQALLVSPNAAFDSAKRSQTPDPYVDTQSSQISLDGKDETVVVKRLASEVLLGTLDFGTLMRVAMTIKRLKLTGVLEVKNETRRLHIEYKEGKTFSNSQVVLIESAFTWESGNFNFNAMAMLSRDCPPIDLDDIITRVVHEQLSLNPILRAIGFELRHFIRVTEYFDPQNHRIASHPWWKQCLGETRLNDVMGAGEMPMDILAKDIYRAWLCDEITFTDIISSEPAKVTYITNPRVNLHDKREKSKLTLDSSNDSHLNAIRDELVRVKQSFDRTDGYAILGLKQGCGTKALDDAYYAWINRYHTDRYIRYKDPELIQMANDLVMMMNNVYPRLSKSERIGSAGMSAGHSSASMPAVSAIDSGLGNPRIGSSRHRISTLDVSDTEREKLSKVSRELQALRSNDKERTYSASNQRVFIRPSSSSSQDSVPSHLRAPSSTPPRVQRMSDILAARRSAQRPSASSSDSQLGTSRLSSQIGVRKSGAELRKVSSAVSPDQYFQTGRKKLLLDLIPDAIDAFQMAVQGEPENYNYKVFLTYAQALQDPKPAADAIEEFKAQLPQAKADYSSTHDKEKRELIFALSYFAGKLELISEMYDEALEHFNLALRITPSDIDTQRCMRFVQQQIEKRKENEKPKKGFFNSLKGTFNKNL